MDYMKVLIATDAHIFHYSGDDTYWTDKIYGYAFWQRYLDVYDEVRIVARVKSINSLNDKLIRVDGPHIEIYGIPFFQGPKQLAIKFFKIQKQLNGAYRNCSVAIYRMPSQTAQMAYWHKPKSMPFGGEIVYDPWNDVHNKKAQHRLINLAISTQLQKFCKKANGVSYVTKDAIQKHYPSKARRQGRNTTKHFETYYSTITLNKEAFTGPRDFNKKNKIVLAMSSVSMESDRKGEKVVIETVYECREKGYEVSAILIGDGSKRKEFEQLSQKLGIDDYIEFTGLLPSSDEVRKVLNRSDIFVFPSQGEGLPRGILEAMAAGMPVLSTPVGGIPEVIEHEYLFAPTDVEGFSNKVCYLMNHKAELNKMSDINYKKSLEFSNDKLQLRRNKFYAKLKKLAEDRK